MTGKRTKRRGSKASEKPVAESALRPSKATRDLVAVAAGGGTPESDIATALGITLTTLRRVYRKELSTGAFSKRLELVASMYTQGKSGNTAAAKAYLSMQPATTAAPMKAPKQKNSTAPASSPTTSSSGSAEPPPAQPKPLKLGKKEQQKVTARTAQVGSGWADVLPDHTRPQ